jgi:hypothetical protein
MHDDHDMLVNHEQIIEYCDNIWHQVHELECVTKTLMSFNHVSIMEPNCHVTYSIYYIVFKPNIENDIVTRHFATN